MGCSTSVGHVKPCCRWGADRIEKTSLVWGHLCQLMDTFQEGSQARGHNNEEQCRYNSLKPIAAWKVHCHKRRHLFQTAVETIKDEVFRVSKIMGLPPVETKLDLLSQQLGCDMSVNSRYLLRGANPHDPKSIHVAEDAFAADGAPVLDPDLRAKIDMPSEPCSFAVVCQVALGIPIYTKDGETNALPPHQRVYAGSGKRGLSAIPGSTPPVHYHTLITEAGGNRDFVVFDPSRVLVEYVIAYQRQSSVRVDQTERGLDKAVTEGRWLCNNPAWSVNGAEAVGVWVSSIVDHPFYGSPENRGPRNLLGEASPYQHSWGSARGHVKDQWIVFDLHRPVKVEALRVRGTGDQNRRSSMNPKYMRWQSGGSLDGPWVTRAEFCGTSTSEWVEVTLSQPVTSRWWRLCMLDNWGNRNWMHLFGVGVKEAQACAWATSSTDTAGCWLMDLGVEPSGGSLAGEAHQTTQLGPNSTSEPSLMVGCDEEEPSRL